MATSPEPVGNILGFETIGVATGLTTVQGLSFLPADGFGNRVRCNALIVCEQTVDSGTKGNVAVRYRGDGTDPTVDVGQELRPGSKIELNAGLAALKFIGVAANAKVTVTYLPYNPYAKTV